MTKDTLMAVVTMRSTLVAAGVGTLAAPVFGAGTALARRLSWAPISALASLRKLCKGAWGISPPGLLGLLMQAAGIGTLATPVFGTGTATIRRLTRTPMLALASILTETWQTQVMHQRLRTAW